MGSDISAPLEWEVVPAGAGLPVEERKVREGNSRGARCQSQDQWEPLQAPQQPTQPFPPDPSVSVRARVRRVGQRGYGIRVESCRLQFERRRTIYL